MNTYEFIAPIVTAVLVEEDLEPASLFCNGTIVPEYVTWSHYHCAHILLPDNQVALPGNVIVRHLKDFYVMDQTTFNKYYKEI